LLFLDEKIAQHTPIRTNPPAIISVAGVVGPDLILPAEVHFRPWRSASMPWIINTRPTAAIEPIQAFVERFIF
jgi:hypothetical protein